MRPIVSDIYFKISVVKTLVTLMQSSQWAASGGKLLILNYNWHCTFMFLNSCCYGMSCCLLQRFTADVLFFTAPFVSAAVWVTRYQVDNKLLNTCDIETFAFPVLIHYFSHKFNVFDQLSLLKQLVDSMKRFFNDF